MKPTTIILLAVFCVTGCSLSPLRVFQDKVPAPVEKKLPQIESERRAADLLARKIEKPVELIPVAAALSASLGAPDKAIVADKPADLPKAAQVATTDLQAQISAMQRQIADLNKLLLKNQGKDIEGTGFSLLGPGMATIVIALIALGVLCPPALTLMIFAFKRMKATAGIVVNAVEDVAKSPEAEAAVDAIKAKVQSAMQAHPSQTTALKDTITNLKTA